VHLGRRIIHRRPEASSHRPVHLVHPPRSILLSAHYSQYALTLGTWVCVLFILSLMINAASLFAHWATAGVALNIIHPGYFAPIVAGSFVASLGLSSVQLHHEALAAFGVGVFSGPS
jgi:tellurite resistance protein